MKSWLILKILSVTDLQRLWIIKSVNLSEFYSSFISFINLMFFLNDTSLIFFMLATLQKLLIQNDCHLLGKEIPHQSQQSLIMKIRQSECLRRFWICDIQNQTVIFSIRFADLIVILILSGIIQMIMNSEMHLKFYMNITHNILTNQVCSLLNQSWFAISQQGQAEKKSRTQFWRLFQAHYFSLTESSIGKMVSELQGQSSCSKWGVILRAVSC